VTSALAPGSGVAMRVWIDQDLCTGDGLCTDHCPEIFVLLDDGISYVREGGRIGNDPGGSASAVHVPSRYERAVVDAALDCPGECIFVEDDLPVDRSAERAIETAIFDGEVVDAELVDPAA
jgi:ferredoxin